MTPDEMIDAIDMQPVIRVLAVSLILLVLGVGVMVVEGQPVQDDCKIFSPADVDYDATEYIMYIYDLYYAKGEQDKANALFKELAGSTVRFFIGTYQYNDYWLFVMTRGNDGQFFAYVGDDWTIGDDGAWHNPCGIFILNRFKRGEWQPVERYTNPYQKG
jgi:hypothetical protein